MPETDAAPPGPARRRRRALGGLLPGAPARRAQIPEFAAWWERQNREALAADGPLWVALGDSATQGIGASEPTGGWVMQVLGHLPGWRVVNLAVTGATAGDVLRDQVPQLERFGPVALVTCAAGTNDLLKREPGGLPGRMASLIAALPGEVSVVATLPRGVRERRAAEVNDVIVTAAAHRGMRVADVWALTGPPWKGKYSADHFHPNDLGYRDWAAAFLEALGALGR